MKETTSDNKSKNVALAMVYRLVSAENADGSKREFTVRSIMTLAKAKVAVEKARLIASATGLDTDENGKKRQVAWYLVQFKGKKQSDEPARKYAHKFWMTLEERYRAEAN